MRIAVCLSEYGTCPNIVLYDEYLSKLGYLVDYYIHGWESNRQNIENVVSALNIPASNYLIESDEKRKKVIERLISTNKTSMEFNTICEKYGTRFFSLMRSANLKTNKEIANQFLYDICIGITNKINIMKYKTVLCKQIVSPAKNTIYTFGGKPSSIFPFFIVNHQYFYADTITFNKMAEFFRFIDLTWTFNSNTIPDVSFAYYIKMLNLTNNNTNTIY